LCAIALEHVRETMRPLPTVRLGGAPPFVQGVAVIRGQPTPVVDLGRLLGGEGEAASGRWLTVRAGERSVALAVESVVGVRDLSELPVSPPSPLLGELAAARVAALGALDSELLLVLAGARWVPATVWDAVAAEGEAS
jgi:purine-binding chemotaxis protein CheW